MRLIEVKQKFDELISGSQIQIEFEQKFGGSAFVILKSHELFSVLEFLSHQDWNKNDYMPISEIITKHNALKNSQITIEQSEYQQLNTYVTQINQQLPIFIGIINSVAEVQSPEDINIKLSSAIDTPEKLEKLVKQITELSKYSNIDGGRLKFSGFDTGSSWVVVTAATSMGYAFIMACLKLTQQYLKTKEIYYKTEEAKFHYMATLNKDEKFTEEGLRKHLEKYSEAQLQTGAQTIAESVKDSNGHALGEVGAKAINTTKSLINIIGDGNEIHLSLSSPTQISENLDGFVEMDYSYLAELKKKPETKTIATGAASKKSET